MPATAAGATSLPSGLVPTEPGVSSGRSEWKLKPRPPAAGARQEEWHQGGSTQLGRPPAAKLVGCCAELPSSFT